MKEEIQTDNTEEMTSAEVIKLSNIKTIREWVQSGASVTTLVSV